MSEWEQVDAESTIGASTPTSSCAPANGCPAAIWLASKGLGKQAAKILEATDAEEIDDLKLIDEKMVEQVIKDSDLKLVSAKKLREALSELRAAGGEQASPGASAEVAPATAVPAEPAIVQEKQPVQERIVICIDRSGSMGAPFKEITLNVVKGESKDSVAQRTRMEAVKAMFYAFRDRVESMGQGSHELGLLQFDQYVDKMLDLTPELDKFESIVDDMQKRGQTAIYSAIIEATKMLAPTFDKENPTDLRILVLTDGQNNSGAPPEEALTAVNAIHATVDAILVGDSPDANLRRIVTATEGECYQIFTLGEGFELLEAESVVSLCARRGGAEKVLKPREAVSFQSIQEKAMVSSSAAAVSAVQTDHCKKKFADVKSIDLDHAPSKSACSPAAVRRVLSELKKISEDDTAAEGVHIFPSPDDVMFWRALIEGPAGSPFEGGVFSLAVTMPSDYPFKPPKIHFETPVYHCNINGNGAICMDILKDAWNPALTVYKCLLAIRGLLLDPNPNDAMRQWIAELTLAHSQSGGSDTRYYDEAKKETAKHASKTVEEWKKTLQSQGPSAPEASSGGTAAA
mmetsp:Transcript_66705/g.159483  ORF Transcript_66705/g.159483 Transcript_66705/m.159483 type:complete len:574 (+) Transcript_66705:75-1796(+)|eukprot:CAMPEP_0178425764 /NCGR_PEP_ID=MMETSP0689_2-20121128/28888_1 /TAXON_ID=160604 /ORGANISM="Amphidinium massartii, Strain CS-259" /LENGTH=573 /DNA_ID=CAMNT_0020047431 /DNA_START=58 /DNA_END=1779 /DNA_ORIENTATION=+